jgi:hypothetical protein
VYLSLSTLPNKLTDSICSMRNLGTFSTLENHILNFHSVFLLSHSFHPFIHTLGASPYAAQSDHEPSVSHMFHMFQLFGGVDGATGPPTQLLAYEFHLDSGSPKRSCGYVSVVS